MKKRRKKKSGSPRIGGPGGLLGPSGNPTEVGGGESRVPAQEKQVDPAKMVLLDQLRCGGWGVPNREASVRCVPRWLSRWFEAGEVPSSWTSVRRGQAGGSLAELSGRGTVSGVPQLVVDVTKSVACPESIDCCGSSHGKGTMGDWWSSPPPFSKLTLHTRVLTSDSWPQRMRA